MTLAELIMSAEYNLNQNNVVGKMLAQDQLIKVVDEICNGKELYDEIEE